MAIRVTMKAFTITNIDLLISATISSMPFSLVGTVQTSKISWQ